ncbi:hypothetical protein M422DRAFT_187187, partial [Sphaerobolus stellatus SS14]
ILFLSDPDVEFGSKLGPSLDLSALGLGLRDGRFAIVIGDLKVKYIGHDLHDLKESVLSSF